MTIGEGCEKCGNSGFRGRLGFYELIKVGPALRAGISEGRSTIELRGLLGDDFVSMREDGVRKAIEGITTPAEVLRATQDVDDFGG
jgi:type II secretory ATPase GspE/PulE/Tfp pilus assembly ATPase PilB-like protein